MVDKKQKQSIESYEDLAKTFRELGENLVKLSLLLTQSTADGANGSTNKAPSKKRVRDESLPKRPLTSYIHFSVSERNRIMKENPKATNTEVASLLGKEWNSLNEKQRKPFVDMAKKDKERYDRELTNVKNNNAPVSSPSKPEVEKEVDNDIPKAKKQKQKESSTETKKSSSSSKKPVKQATPSSDEKSNGSKKKKAPETKPKEDLAKKSKHKKPHKK
ncbi:high mobility group box domain-containing protein [Cunninghamella echinulata]|nr:high mobility group box domain-containing protein [Cunninghamella echinulata]